MAALEYLETGDYDGVILDVMMPKMDGMEVLRKIRERGDNTPVLILTAKSEVDDKVAGLDGGANDYLTKPFSPKELLARIRAMTRNQVGVADSVLQVGNITLNRSTNELSSPVGNFTLANKEFQVMEMLMCNPRHLIPTERFLEKIWGYNSSVEVNVVWVYFLFGKKLTALGGDVQIKATRNTGYSLEILL
ncbi:MAG: response regulator transcription factor [Blautia sp.]